MNVPPITVLPEAFLDRAYRVLGSDDVADWEGSLQRVSIALRWTGDRDEVEDASAYLKQHEIPAEPVPWYREAWRIGDVPRRSVTALEWVKRQTLFLQSLSSMAAVMALDVRPGHDVLDLCAAPGGKTSLIHRLQQGQGILVANELSRARTKRMTALLTRLGIDDVDIQTRAGESFGGGYERCFDRVLADVPCSGEGRFHLADAASWSRWSESAIRGLSKRQVGLLESACRTLRLGGRVLYSTCTMAPEENELVIDRVLRRMRTPMKVHPIALHTESFRPGLAGWEDTEYLADVQQTVRVVPGSGMTPFFLACLERVE